MRCRRHRARGHEPRCGCGSPMRAWEALCGGCWAQLPQDYRERLTSARAQRAPHLVARAAIDARAWLARNGPAVRIARMLGEEAPL